MTKYEFLGKLDSLLTDLSEEEREQAMKYYEDYFADAGEEQEEFVIEELGSPEELARQIKESSPDQIEYGEGIHTGKNNFPQPVSENNTQSEPKKKTWTQQNAQSNFSEQENANGQKPNDVSFDQNMKKNSQANRATNKNNTSRIILIIVLLICSSPLWISLFLGVFSVLFSIVCILFGIFCGFFFGGAGISIAGVGCVFSGIYMFCSTNIPKGVLTTGVGLILLPVGIILCYFALIICIKGFPIVMRWVSKFLNWCSKQLQTLF